MERAQKEQVITSLQGSFSEAGTVVVIQYKGMTVAEITTLRNQARQAGAFIQVTKNTLTKRALKGTPYEALTSLFTGPTAIVYSDDEVAAAKAVVNYGKNNEKLVIVGGAIGATVLDVNGIKTVAALPSLDESRAKIIGLLNAPAAKLLSILQAPGGQVARVIKAKSEVAAN